MIRLLSHPSPVRKLCLFLSLPVCCQSSLMERGGGGKSYDGEKAWSYINHSILFDQISHFVLFNISLIQMLSRQKHLQIPYNVTKTLFLFKYKIYKKKKYYILYYIIIYIINIIPISSTAWSRKSSKLLTLCFLVGKNWSIKQYDEIYKKCIFEFVYPTI